MTRQKRLLSILLAGLLLAAGYAFWATPRQQRVAPLAGDLPKSRPVAATVESDIPQVNLQLLTRAGEETYRGYRRNIFAPLYKSTALAPPPQPVIAKEEAPPVVAPEVILQPEREETRRALARFTFLGFLQKNAEKTVFLSAADEIFVVKRGDRFGQGREFFVTHISNEMLQVRQGDDPRTISVPLVEQAPLVEMPPPASPNTRARPVLLPPAEKARRLPPPQHIIEEESFPSPEPQGEDEEVKHE